MSANYKKLGDYIQPVDIRNSDLKVSHLLGLSIEKCFIESIANTIGTDFRPYKIVKRGQFAYGPVTSRNGDKITIIIREQPGFFQLIIADNGRVDSKDYSGGIGIENMRERVRKLGGSFSIALTAPVSRMALVSIWPTLS